MALNFFVHSVDDVAAAAVAAEVPDLVTELHTVAVRTLVDSAVSASPVR